MNTCNIELVGESSQSPTKLQNSGLITSDGGINATIDIDIDSSVETQHDIPPSSHSSPVSLSGLFKYATRVERIQLIIGTIAAAMVGVTMPLYSLLYGILTDAIQAGNMAEIKEMCVYLVCLGIAGLIGGITSMTLFLHISERLTQRVRQLYLHRVLSQDIAWHDMHHPETLVQEITAGCEAYRSGLGEKLVLLIQNSAGLIFSIGLSLYKGWELTLILLCPAPFLIASTALIGYLMAENTPEQQTEHGSANMIAQQTFDAIQTIYSNQMEFLRLKQYTTYLAQAYRSARTRAIGAALSLGLYYFFMFGMFALGIFYGGIMVANQHQTWPGRSQEAYTGGTVITILYSLLFGAMLMGQTIPNLSVINASKEAARRLFFVIEEESTIISPSSSAASPQNNGNPIAIDKSMITGRLWFDHVSFSYPTRPTVLVLDRFNYIFENGQTTAICGPSGSGKSTIVQLIERFYDPNGGTIWVELKRSSRSGSDGGGAQDGSRDDTGDDLINEGTHQLEWIDLKTIDIDCWRRLVGLVGQQPTLYEGTIEDNINCWSGNNSTSDDHENDNENQDAMGSCQNDDDDHSNPIIHAAQLANADGFITRRREGYHAAVGVGGSLLSGGERQRICIARALFTHPPLLVFDEATSALDVASEHLVQQTIDSLTNSGRFTMIAIAHRLSTIRRAHMILCMHKGVVVEHGAHDHLMALRGVYYNMVTVGTQQPTSMSVSTPPDDLGDKDMQSSDSFASDPCTKPTDGASIDCDSSTPEGGLVVNMNEAPHLELPPEPHIEPHPHANQIDANALTPSTTSWRHFIWSLFTNHWRILTCATLCAFVVGGSFPAYSYLMAQAIDHMYGITTSRIRHYTEIYAGYLVLLALGTGITAVVYFFTLSIIAEKTKIGYQSQLFEVFVRNDLSFYQLPSCTSSKLTTLLSSAPSALRTVLIDVYGPYTCVFSTIVISYIVGYTIGWQIALVMTFVVPTMILVGAVQLRLVDHIEEQYTHHIKHLGAISTEALSNIRTTMALCLQQPMMIKTKHTIAQCEHLALRSAWCVGIGYGLTQFVMFASYALAFWLGGKLTVDQTLSVPALLDVLFMIEMALTTAPQLFTQSIYIERASHALKEMSLFQSYKSQSDIGDEDGFRPSIPNGCIEFVDVHFQYQTSAQATSSCTTTSVLNGVSFRSPDEDSPSPLQPPPKLEEQAGRGIHSFSHQYPSQRKPRVLAIVGESGGGKSTIFKLIQRFYELNKVSNPSNTIESNIGNGGGSGNSRGSGSILLDGHDISTMPLSYLRKHLAVVEQDPQLFRGTIRENIIGGTSNPSDDDIIYASRIANIHDMIMQFPQQYDTMIDSTNISGGQKQRIAMARGILRRPKLLLLDEATSALDNVTMMSIHNALDSMMDQCTIIVIAHRMETIQNADHVILLRGGRVQRQGTYQQLFQNEIRETAQSL